MMTPAMDFFADQVGALEIFVPGRGAADVQTENDLQTQNNEDDTSGDLEALRFDAEKIKQQIIENQKCQH